MRERGRLVVIPAGGLAAVGSGYATYLTYADYLTELAELVGGLCIYAPIYRAEHPEYDYFSQKTLDPALCDVVPLDGHGRSVGGTALLGNYLRQARVFSQDAASWTRVLVYSPSVTAGLVARALKRRSSPNCAVYTYVWGDWAELSQHLPQVGLVRKTLDPWQRRWICAQERWLVARSTMVWVAGARLREQYASLGDHVRETTPMIKASELLAHAPERTQREPYRVLYVGRLTPGKGLEVLLEALATLANELPAICVRLVGSGDHAFITALLDKAESLGIRDRIALLGVLPNGPELWDEYQRAAAFVLPSFSEGFPRVVYEAMALGTPIVATTVGSIPLVLESGHHALLVPPGAVLPLADAVRQILTVPERGAHLAGQARRLFETRIAYDGVSTARQISDAILHDDRAA